MKTADPRAHRYNPTAAVELLGMLVRAAVVGVIAGMVLGGATLLLSSDDDIPLISEAATIHAASLRPF